MSAACWGILKKIDKSVGFKRILSEAKLFCVINHDGVMTQCFCKPLELYNSSEAWFWGMKLSCIISFAYVK